MIDCWNSWHKEDSDSAEITFIVYNKKIVFSALTPDNVLDVSRRGAYRNAAAAIPKQFLRNLEAGATGYPS